MEPATEPRSYGRGLLLDTYALICALARPDDLPARVTGALLDEYVPVFISAASVWEIEINVATGKLPRPSAPTAHAARDQGFTELPVTSAEAAARLPLHHRDPFDRMLVAQSHLERLTLVASDHLLSHHDSPLLRR